MFCLTCTNGDLLDEHLPVASVPSSLRMHLRFVIVTLLFSMFVPSADLFGQDEKSKTSEAKKVDAAENPFPNRHPAPELEGGVEWLNSAGPISLKDLRGKVVLIDFWTFCCINCMHVLPDLAYLEKKYPNELVVVGVHSAKFDNEKETGNIRKAILRYEIEHPVVNDANMTIWQKFGVNSWPTVVLLDPEGRYCGHVSGEGNRELLEQVIDKLIAYHRAKGTLDETPVRFDLERNKGKDTPLRFPGKLLIDEANGRLFISDSNHNRIVVSSLDGKLVDVIGRGAIGKKDGGYADAEFNRPQGMTIVGNTLYVADTENHSLRTVDLDAKTVATFAGTGQQNRNPSPGGVLLETSLNSPWDLTVVDGVLYVAMAGPHQIWAHKLGSTSISQYAGSGREDIINGDLGKAAFAQPSGIVNDGNFLYVVDSEGSAVRKISTDPQNDLENPKGTVTTIAGTHDLPNGRSLFEFGHTDGAGDEARFQHPLGLALHDRALYVADSYNHKIRRVDLKTKRVSTWIGINKPGTGLDPVQFAEPAGIAFSDKNMFVADTNNHRIVVIDIATKKAHELVIAGLTPPEPSSTEHAATSNEAVTPMDVELQQLMATNGIDFRIEFELPDGYKLNPLLPVAYRLKVDGEQSVIASDQLNVKQEATTEGTGSRFTVPTLKKTGEATLLLSVTYGYCREGNGGVCKVATSTWKIPTLLTDKGKANSVNLKAKAR